jgi:DNA-binding NarL/FixJ family response regulator
MQLVSAESELFSGERGFLHGGTRHAVRTVRGRVNKEIERLQSEVSAGKHTDKPRFRGKNKKKNNPNLPSHGYRSSPSWSKERLAILTDMVQQGKTNKEIADAMGDTYASVAGAIHRYEIFRKNEEEEIEARPRARIERRAQYLGEA